MTPFFFSHVYAHRAILDGEEARHCLKVMRHRVGEHVVGIDGQGRMITGPIVATGKDSVEIEIREVVENWGEKPLQVSLAVSMLHKPDRFEWLMEKSVELGVTHIYIYQGKHTVKTGVRIDRMERILQAALKQCMRSRMPHIEDVGSFSSLMKKTDGDLKILAHSSGQTEGKWMDQIRSAAKVDLLIGPEGDFAPEELSAAEKAGFHSISLGLNRLRSETAAIHLLSIVKHLSGY